MTYASAKQAYAEASVMTATPEQLIVMLYDGAIRFLRQATVAVAAGDRENARARMRRAEAIIDELNLSLDMNQGEVAARLRSIYLFCKRHLWEAQLRQDTAPIEDVTKLLSELREAWDGIASSGTAASTAVAAGALGAATATGNAPTAVAATA
jgi:flagellar protein FliS